MKTKLLFLLLLAGVTSHAEGVEPINEVFEPKAPANINEYSKVAVIQSVPSRPAPVGVSQAEVKAFKEMARSELEAYIEEAASKGAKLIITSEFGLIGFPDIPELSSEDDEFRNREDIKYYVETVPGPSTKYFSQLAKKLKIYLHIGFAEVDPKDDKYYNVAVAIDPTGKIVAKHRKVNLYQLEHEFVYPGTEATYYDSPWGRIGLLICADVYSSFPLTAYKAAKVDVLALSTSWARYNTGMSTFRRAAMNYRMSLLAANQPYFPDSGVINPDGTFQSHIRQSDGPAYGYLKIKNKKK